MTLSDRTHLHQPFCKSNTTLNFNPSFLALIVLPQSEAYHCAEFHRFRLRTSCSQTQTIQTQESQAASRNWQSEDTDQHHQNKPHNSQLLRTTNYQLQSRTI